jgi:hypothetical protein
VSALRAAGLSPVGRLDPDRGLRIGHATALVEPGGARLELRWGAFRESAGDEDFWSGAVAAHLGAAETLAPGPTQQLLYACAHGVRSGPEALIWIADATLILRTAASEIDWACLVDGAAQRELAFTTGAALAIVRELTDAPIPDRVLAELRARPSRARERLLLRLSRRHGPGVRHLQLWDSYRRRTAAAEDGDIYRGFREFLADAKRLSSRPGS